MRKKILLGSPVRQKPEILTEFLRSLTELDTTGLSLGFFFVDDNEDALSSRMLRSFPCGEAGITVAYASDIVPDLSENSYSGHNWDYDLIERVADMKNHIIDAARARDYSHLFFIDSDIVLHPQSLKQLLSDEKDIVANIFWTRFSSWDTLHPQVWQMDQRALYNPRDRKTKKRAYKTAKEIEFIESFKQKGVFQVGGLGACTLISHHVLEAGVNFSSLYNISFWGEDRSFCIRAVAAGFELFVDTHYPAYHIYRMTDLDGVEAFKKNGFDFNRKEKNLTVKELYNKKIWEIKRNIRLFIYRMVHKDQ